MNNLSSTKPTKAQTLSRTDNSSALTAYVADSFKEDQWITVMSHQAVKLAQQKQSSNIKTADTNSDGGNNSVSDSINEPLNRGFDYKSEPDHENNQSRVEILGMISSSSSEEGKSGNSSDENWELLPPKNKYQNVKEYRSTWLPFVNVEREYTREKQKSKVNNRIKYFRCLLIFY